MLGKPGYGFSPIDLTWSFGGAITGEVIGGLAGLVLHTNHESGNINFTQNPRTNSYTISSSFSLPNIH